MGNQIVNTSTPNVWSWSFRGDPLNDVTWTVYRAVPGDTVPRLSMTNYNHPDAHIFVDCGPFERPERFGKWRTFDEFREFAQRFAAEASGEA